jgi:hypothetical protein
MMLSPQAARMGTVYTTLRSIGKAGTRRFFGGSSSRRVVSFKSTTSRNENKQLSDTFRRQQLKQQRFKSSVGVAANFDTDSDDEGHHDLGYTHAGQAAAAEYRAKNAHIDEPWMINLGRGNDNAWLMGRRDEQEWFTGLAPVKNCPGKLNMSNCIVSSTAI